MFNFFKKFFKFFLTSFLAIFSFPLIIGTKSIQLLVKASCQIVSGVLTAISAVAAAPFSDYIKEAAKFVTNLSNYLDDKLGKIEKEVFNAVDEASNFLANPLKKIINETLSGIKKGCKYLKNKGEIIYDGLAECWKSFKSYCSKALEALNSCIDKTKQSGEESYKEFRQWFGEKKENIIEKICESWKEFRQWYGDKGERLSRFFSDLGKDVPNWVVNRIISNNRVGIVNDNFNLVRNLPLAEEKKVDKEIVIKEAGNPKTEVSDAKGYRLKGQKIQTIQTTK
jgi:hypothetical protein